MRYTKSYLTLALMFELSLSACSQSSEPAPEPIIAPTETAPPQPLDAPEITHIKPISIQKIQAALSRHGENVKIDGRMGPATKAAIKSFQQKNNLTVTGITDKETLRRLGLK